MTNKSILLPEGWGFDFLSKFQTIAFKNELATFVQTPEWQNLLCDVTTVLHKCSEHAMEDRLKYTEDKALYLFFAAHSQYLASVRSVVAGHCLAAYPTGRATIEFALYGWYLATNAEAVSRWHNKPTAKNDIKIWNNEFKFSELAKKLGIQIQGLEKWAKYLHQTAIDFGGHPNPPGIYSNIEYQHSVDVSGNLKITYLHPWNDISKGTTKFTIETGMFTISLFALGFPDAKQKLNLIQDTERLSESLNHLVSVTEFDDTVV